MTKYCPHCFKKNEFESVTHTSCSFCKKTFLSAFKVNSPIAPLPEPVLEKDLKPQKRPFLKSQSSHKKSYDELEAEEFTEGNDQDYNEIKAQLMSAVSEDDVILDGDNSNVRISSLDGRVHPRGERLQRPQ